MKEALIAFVRGFVAAGVAEAVAVLTANLDLEATQLAVVVGIAFLTGAINFIGAYLRETTTPVATKRTMSFKEGSKFDWLPF